MFKDIEKLLTDIESSDVLKNMVSAKTLTEIKHNNKIFPIISFTIGCNEQSAPTLFITGGVHGLEKVGAQLAWSILKTTLDRLIWDKLHQKLFKQVRLVVIPLLNPVGYANNTRSNGNGVDLMRNSPVQAVEETHFLVGGHRYSSRLPWYQGEAGVIEKENRALIDCFQSKALHSSRVISIDFHSGFGMKDRLWFPFSYKSTPFDHIGEMYAITQLFEELHPYHIYKIEPQTDSYLLNGDIWDYLYLEYLDKNKTGVYLPLTLEMGSWSWVRKNPWQLFSKHGAFNPIKEHRLKRTYRRHHLLFDFLLRALHSHEVWAGLDDNRVNIHRRLGVERWYA